MSISLTSILDFYQQQPYTVAQAAKVTAIIVIAYVVFAQLAAIFVTTAKYIIVGAGGYHCLPFVQNFLKERFS